MISNSSNFREINCGNLSPKLLYRSNHPICNGKQVKDIILATSNAKIQTIINLSDNTLALKQKIVCCPWYRKIFEKNNVIVLNIDGSFDIMDDKFNKKLRDGLLFMMNHEPPYLIHCEEGVDRMGFLSMFLESFMGAKFDDIANDYMLLFVDGSEYSLNDYRNKLMKQPPGETFQYRAAMADDGRLPPVYTKSTSPRDSAIALSPPEKPPIENSTK